MFPIHMDLGFRVFPFYEGLYFVIAIVTGVLWARSRLAKARLDLALFDEALVWILVGAVVGARLFHFAFWDWDRLAADPLIFFRVWEGGLTIVGGLVGGIGAGAWVFAARKADFWRHFAVVSPALLLGQAVGRVGCFLNGDAWGIPTNLPWGVPLPKFGTLVPAFQLNTDWMSPAWDWAFRHGLVGADALVTPPLHPTQLYEALADLVLLVGVLALSRRIARKGGPWARVFWLHAGGYALIRFLVEFLHGDHESTDLWAMTALQLGLAALVVVAGLAFALWKAPAAPASTKPRKGA